MINVGITTYKDETVARKHSFKKLKSIFISFAGPETFQASHEACLIDTGHKNNVFKKSNVSVSEKKLAFFQ